jgi:hypothetical protein
VLIASSDFARETAFRGEHDSAQMRVDVRQPSLQGAQPAIRMESTLGFAAIAVEAAARSREFARLVPARILTFHH